MTTRFTLADILNENPLTPLQEEAIRVLSKADYRPEPIDSPYMEGWTVKDTIRVPVRALEAFEILEAYQMPVQAIYCLRKPLMRPLTGDEADVNLRSNIATIVLMAILAPLTFYFLLGRLLLYQDTIIFELSDGSHILVLRWYERLLGRVLLWLSFISFSK